MSDIIDTINNIIELSKYYIYDDIEKYMNHIKNLEKLKDKIESKGIDSVLSENKNGGKD